MDAKKSSELGIRSSKFEDLPLNSNLLEYYGKQEQEKPLIINY